MNGVDHSGGRVLARYFIEDNLRPANIPETGWRRFRTLYPARGALGHKTAGGVFAMIGESHKMGHAETDCDGRLVCITWKADADKGFPVNFACGDFDFAVRPDFNMVHRFSPFGLCLIGGRERQAA